MNKQEFIEKLCEKLSRLPQKEVEDRIAFYIEMINDKIEDGIAEEDAVREIGDIDQIVAQIVADIPLAKIVKANVKPKRRLSAWEIVLIVLGAPVWLSLLIGVVAAIFSAYLSLWAVIVCLCAVAISVSTVAVFGIIWGGIMLFAGDTLVNLILFSVGIACAGLAIFGWFGCKYAIKGLIILTKKIILGIKNSFVKKEVK